MKKLIAVLVLALSLCFVGDSLATAGLSDTFLVGTPSGAVYPKTAFISATTAGDNTVVAAVAGKKIVVWHFEVSASAVANVYWKSGTTQITEIVYLDTSGWSRQPVYVSSMKPQITPVLRTNAGEALVLNSTVTAPVGVWVKYTEE